MACRVHVWEALLKETETSLSWEEKETVSLLLTIIYCAPYSYTALSSFILSFFFN